MNSFISHIWQLSDSSIQYFSDAILGAFLEYREAWDTDEQKLFEAILTRELPRDYVSRLSDELSQFWLQIDHTGKTSPVVCQNVHPHWDKIQGSHRSIIANVWKQTWELLIHHPEDKKVIASAPLVPGRIIEFSHYKDMHSVNYTGNPESFLMIVKASVEDTML